jgi:starch synthase
MRVLEIASEAIPFAKTGGLADVAGSLPAALARLGCDVTLVIPAHREALGKGITIEPAGIEFDVPIGERREPARILRARVPGGFDALLVDHPGFFDRPALYGDYPDDAARWMFFARAAAEISARLEAPFDIVHCHDWQAGLVPALLKLLPPVVPAATRTVMTIHNMAYQGSFPAGDMPLTGLDWRYFNWKQMECHDRVNLLKTGIVFADLVTTVSPTYAREIQSSPGGCGLEGVLAQRSGTVAGIVNGIDTVAWNPATDPYLPPPTRRRGSRPPRRCSMPGSGRRPPTAGRWWRSWGGWRGRRGSAWWSTSSTASRGAAGRGSWSSARETRTGRGS